MDNDSLSQDEIDALFASTLGGEAISSDDGDGALPPTGLPPADAEAVEQGISNLSEVLIPVLQKQLSAATRRTVSLEAPSFNSVSQADCLEEHKGTSYLKTRITLSGALSGQIVLLFSKREALTIADLVAGRFDGSEIPEEADDLHLDAFNEALGTIQVSMGESLSGRYGGQVDVDFSQAEIGMLDGAADGLPGHRTLRWLRLGVLLLGTFSPCQGGSSHQTWKSSWF